MVQWLKQSTAFTFRIGPFVDAVDGYTPETGLTIAQADIQISKAGGAFDQTSEGSPTTTHDKSGWYQCPLTVTDTNTLGTLDVEITMAGARPVYRSFMVMPANVFDSLVNGPGADYLDVDLHTTQPAVTFGRINIIGNALSDGALHIENTNGGGFGVWIIGGARGAVIQGSNYGVMTAGGSGYGIYNTGNAGAEFPVPLSEGAEMNLSSDYDAAKTAAQAGDEMALEDGAIKAATFDGDTAYPKTAPDAEAMVIP